MEQLTPAQPVAMSGAIDRVASDLSGGFIELGEPNDTPEQAIGFGRNWFGSGLIGRIGDTPNGADDVDLVTFSLEAGERLFIETDSRDGPGLSQDLTTALRVFDSSGTELAFDYQSYGADLGSFISFEAPQDGTYAVGVSGAENFDYDPTVEGSGAGGFATGPYRLKVWYGDISEASDTLEQADDFTDRLRETGDIDLTGFLGDTDSRANDADLLLFELEAGEILLLEVNAVFVGKFNGFDTVLRVFDSSGTELAVNTNPDRWFSLLSFEAPTDGVYAVGVSSHGSSDYDPTVEGSGTGGDHTGVYDLRVRFGDLAEPGDTIGQAEDFTEALRETGSLSLTGIIGDSARWGDDVDLALFRLEAEEVVYFDIRGDGLEFADLSPMLRVFDSSGNELAVYDDPYGGGPGLRFEAPVAGTYAVGISSDSNGDYDPMVDGGTQSAPWNAGPYRLTVTAAETELEIGLYDADSDELIAPIEDGGRIRVDGIEGRNLTIAAIVPEGSPLFGFVESVRIDLNGGAVTRTESFGAFSLFGDARGDFQGGVIPAGDNTVTFDLFSEDGLRGDFLGSISRDFTIVDFSAALEIGLYDADSDELITLIGDGEQIRLDGVGDRSLTIAAIVPPDSPLFDEIESMRLDLNDGAVTRTESFGAFSLFGDSRGDFQGGDIPAGDNRITLDLFSEDGLRGDFLGSITRNFAIVDFGTALEIGLYDADTDELIAPIEDGGVIQFGGAADRNLTIAAIVPSDSPLADDVQSMRLDLNDGAVTQTENFGAYTLFGDPGGDFRGGDIPLGENLITFDLFSENRLQGDFLGSVSRSFTLVDPAAPPDPDLALFDIPSDGGGTAPIDLPFVDDLL